MTVSFAGRTAVRDVSFDVHEGEITALIGPSGSGKTTAASCTQPDARHGAIGVGQREHLLGDLDVYAAIHRCHAAPQSRVGMVFQRPNPFPTMSIYENAVAGLRFNGVRKKALLDEAAESALDRRRPVGQRARPAEGARHHPVGR